jgi:glycosyltransferase involved in cell wall biosynthesis
MRPAATGPASRTGHPMNVCMVAYAPYHYDTRLMCYAETLAALGHTVDVFALSAPGEKRRKTIRGVNLHPLLSRGRSERSPVSYLRKIMSFFVCAGALVTYRDLRKHYDLIHVHSVPDFLVFTAFLPSLRGARVILDIHDLLPELYASKFGKSEASWVCRLLRYVERRSAAFADHVIAANDLWRTKLVSRSVREEKCSVILTLPDRTLFRRRGRIRRDDKFIILYPGTLNHHQGVDIAIRALDLIKHAAPTAEFHIYGAGPEEIALKQLTAELSLQSRVKFHGIQPLSDIPGLMENADLGVVPKRNDLFGNEAFSTKALELMAMGVPIVVADTAVDRYYFDASMVKFFKAGDEASLADSILLTIRDYGLRDKLVRNASRFVARNDWGAHRHKYIDIVNFLTKPDASASSTKGAERFGTERLVCAGVTHPQVGREAMISSTEC